MAKEDKYKEINAVKNDKLKALDAAISQIEKQYGKVFAAGESELLCCRGFDAYLVFVASHDFRQAGFHGRYVRVEFRMLSTDGGVDVSDLVTFCGNEVDDAFEDDLAVHVECLLGVVGEVVTNIAHVGGAEECVADSVDEDVGIAVTEQSHGVRNLYTSQNQFTAFHEFVDVVAHSYSYHIIIINDARCLG